MESPKAMNCHDCGASLENGYRGEEITIKRFLKPDIKKWIYRCPKCYDLQFVKMVNSDPRLLARFWDIYGKSPEEQLKEYHGNNDT